MSTLARFLIFSGTACNSTATVTSEAIRIDSASGNFAVSLDGATGADIAVTYEVSQDGTNYDVTTSSPSRTIIASLTTATIVKGFDAPVAKYMKIRLTGTATNATEAVTVTGHLMFSE